MRSHVLRLYVFSVTLFVFFMLWAMIAARPWAAARSGESPALKALTARERRLRNEVRVVEKTVHRRWAAYRQRLRERQALIRELEQHHAAQVAAASATVVSAPSYGTTSYSAPSSRVVTLPPQVRVVTLPPTGPSTSSGSSHP